MSLGPQDERWRELSYVFVVTYARSGSTLLQSLLNACAGVQIRGENNNALYHLYRAIAAIAAIAAARKDHGGPLALPPDAPWHGAGLIRPGGFEARLLQGFVRCVLAPDPATRVTGFKEIRYNPLFVPGEHFAPYMDFLLSRFPHSKIVFNSRRAEDVATSSFVARQDPAQVLAWVKASDARFASFAAGSARAIHLRYEDWVADHGLIHGMLDFLGLDWDAEAVARVFAKPLTHGKDQALRG